MISYVALLAKLLGVNLQTLSCELDYYGALRERSTKMRLHLHQSLIASLDYVFHYLFKFSDCWPQSTPKSKRQRRHALHQRCHPGES
jgi:hypothetical protein